MTKDRREALQDFLNRPEAEQFELSLAPNAVQKLKQLAAFGVSGDSPEVTRFYASRLLEQALEDLGEDPAEGIAKMPERQPQAPQPGDLAPDAIVLGDEGATIHLKDQWAQQTAALVFLRHYG